MLAARIAGALCAGLSFWAAGVAAAEDIRFEVPTLSAFQRYADLLAQPGFLAIALENNELSPSLSDKLKVTDHGKGAELRRATLRFTGRKGQVFTYEAGYFLGVGSVKVSFPVAVDVSELAAGKSTVILSPPLASLIPADLTERIRLKSQLVANADAQRKLLAYLDRVSKDGDPVQAILIDAYNRSASFSMTSESRDVGDALPLSDQWMLILTLLIWAVAVSAAYVLHWRRRRTKPG